jgi:hypothetical protein
VDVIVFFVATRDVGISEPHDNTTAVRVCFLVFSLRPHHIPSPGWNSRHDDSWNGVPAHQDLHHL